MGRAAPSMGVERDRRLISTLRVLLVKGQTRAGTSRVARTVPLHRRLASGQREQLEPDLPLRRLPGL
jgi:hypothetical protein